MVNYSKQIDFSRNPNIKVAETVFKFNKPIKYIGLTYQQTQKIPNFKNILRNQLEELTKKDYFEYFIAEEKNKKADQLHVHVYLKYEEGVWFERIKENFYVTEKNITIKIYRLKLFNPMVYLLYLHKEDDLAFTNIDLTLLNNVFHKIYENIEKKIGRKVETEFTWETGILIVNEKQVKEELENIKKKENPIDSEIEIIQKDKTIVTKDNLINKIIFSNKPLTNTLLQNLNIKKIIIGFSWKDFSKIPILDESTILIDNYYGNFLHSEIKQLINIREIKKVIDISCSPIFNKLTDVSNMIIYLNRETLVEYNDLNNNNFFNEQFEKIPPQNLCIGNIENIEKIEVNVNTPATDYDLLKQEFKNLVKKYEDQKKVIDSLEYRLEKIENSKK